MKNKTLIIDNVNLEKLEQQRMALNEFLVNTSKEPDYDALSGIAAMLDAWSDRIYFEGEE